MRKMDLDSNRKSLETVDAELDTGSQIHKTNLSGGKRKSDGLIVYHGSNCIVERPDLGKCKESNDYGKGFYLTEDSKKAESWSLLKAVEDFGADAIVNCYKLNVHNLSIFDFSTVKTENWVATLLKYRGCGNNILTTQKAINAFIAKYAVDISNFDLVTGYRADDSYFKIIEAFLNGWIGLDNIGGLLKVGNLGYQIALISEKAFNQTVIEFESYYTIHDSKSKSALRADQNARQICRVMIDRIRDGDKPFIGKSFKEML